MPSKGWERRAIPPAESKRGDPAGPPLWHAPEDPKVSGGLLLEHLGLLRRGAGRDADRARLRRLGHLAGELDMEQAVVEAGADDLDVVGELEAALEGAAGDAAIEVGALLLLLGLAGDHKRVLLDDDLEVVLAEPGDRHGQPVGVFAGVLDVVGG